MIVRTGSNRKNAGLSLITVAIGFTVASILMVSMLPGGSTNGTSTQKSMNAIQRLDAVEKAIQGFEAKNGRLPCPADGQYDTNNQYFGVEASFPGTCTGGTPAAPMGPDAGTGHIVAGVIPTKTLHLDDSYAFDQNGNRIAYYVDLRATLASSCATLTQGGIAIKTATAGTTIANVMHAFVIYGDGHGACRECLCDGGDIAGNRSRRAIEERRPLQCRTHILVSRQTIVGEAFHDRTDVTNDS